MGNFKESYKNSGWYKFWHAEKKDGLAKFVIKETLSYVLIIVAAFCIAILVNIYLIRLSAVSGDSMAYSYHDGQIVWLSKMPYIVGEPKKGDVVIIDHTGAPRTFWKDVETSVKSNAIVRLFSKNNSDEYERTFYIKRVIAVGGDTIMFKDNAVWVNGERLDETSYVKPDEVPDYGNLEGLVYEIPKGKVFVMGDNRNNSLDSRYFGAFPNECILGKVLTKGKINE